MTAVEQIYHEKQSKELCALHVLNNLFQDKNAFSKKDLDDICVSLSPQRFLNPHRSMLGTGNYDVNVIMAAVQLKDMACLWFDKRKDVKLLNLSNINGLILNVPTDFGVGFINLLIRRKHWFAIKKIGSVYYNLDSKLGSPERLGSEKELLRYLHEQLKEGDKELLLVVSCDVETKGTWKKKEKIEVPATEVT